MARQAEAVAKEKPKSENVEERELGASFCDQRSQPQRSKTGTTRVMATARTKRIEESILPRYNPPPYYDPGKWEIPRKGEEKNNT